MIFNSKLLFFVMRESLKHISKIKLGLNDRIFSLFYHNLGPDYRASDLAKANSTYIYKLRDFYTTTII